MKHTIGSPASDSSLIDAGASTTFRIYAQTNEGVARDFATSGWLNDDISALSSSGYTQTGRTTDLVALGDFGWVSRAAIRAGKNHKARCPIYRATRWMGFPLCQCSNGFPYISGSAEMISPSAELRFCRRGDAT